MRPMASSVRSRLATSTRAGCELTAPSSAGASTSPARPVRPTASSAQLRRAVASTRAGCELTGTVVCWGDSSLGGADAPAGRFVAVTAGSYHSCGLQTDRTVACWGWGWQECHGESDPPSGQFTEIAAGASHTCGLRSDNTIACWGDNRTGQSDPPRGDLGEAFSAVSAGDDHTCALADRQHRGLLGRSWHGPVLPARRTVQGDLTPAVITTVAVRFDSTVDCWGNNPDGHCRRARRVRFSAVYCGRLLTRAALTNRRQRSSAGASTTVPDQLDAPAGEFRAMAAVCWHTCGLRVDGTRHLLGRQCNYGDLGVTEAPEGRTVSAAIVTAG